jgi:hypothetical protein
MGMEFRFGVSIRLNSSLGSMAGSGQLNVVRLNLGYAPHPGTG